MVLSAIVRRPCVFNAYCSRHTCSCQQKWITLVLGLVLRVLAPSRVCVK